MLSGCATANLAYDAVELTASTTAAAAGDEEAKVDTGEIVHDVGTTLLSIFMFIR